MQPLNKIRWQCRRGSRELDILCERYLDRCFEQAPQQEQQDFLQLLSMEDNRLQHYLMGDALPESERLAKLVVKMRLLSSAP